jgi:hypothetical protein
LIKGQGRAQTVVNTGAIEGEAAGELAPDAAEGGGEGSGGKKVIITKVIVTKTRHGLGICRPVDGGHDGAVALGWY